MVRPMREELTSAGFQELRTAAEVDAFLADEDGTALVVVNSVCGCAAGGARPGARQAIAGEVRPDRIATVFAGQDIEATARLRSYFADVPPSSPSMALFKDGALASFLPRHRIEGRDVEEVAGDLEQAFRQFCVPVAVA
jgi:putative YphP/YqiW family bacilliredoxin